MDWWADVEQAIGDIPHAVAGAVAANAYAPERMTADIDMVMLAADATRAGSALNAAGWRKIGVLSFVQETSWRDAAGHDLDLIDVSAPWAVEAVKAAQGNRIAGMPTMPLRYLVFMKLQASRTTDLGDVSRMLGRATAGQIEEARGIVARFGNLDDLADFDQLVLMGQLERNPGQAGTETDPPAI